MQIHVPNKYELYLQSPEFDNIRQAVFKRDNHKCVVCGDTENIQPHHLTYINIYNENARDLITLCRKCHATYHAIQKRAEYINEYYEKQKADQNQQTEISYEQQRQEYEIRKKHFLNYIGKKYADKDYSRNGNIDMCDWHMISEVIEKEGSAPEWKNVWINSSSVRDYFLFQRYKLLLRCIEKDIPVNDVINKTKLSENFIRKWYDKEKLKARIEHFEFIYGGNQS